METRKRNQSVAGCKVSSKRLKVDLVEKYECLKAKEAHLDAKISDLESRGVTTDLRPQMQALHRYNEMKDLTQFVLGYLASVEQSTVAELHERYGLPLE